MRCTRQCQASNGSVKDLLSQAMRCVSAGIEREREREQTVEVAGRHQEPSHGRLSSKDAAAKRRASTQGARQHCPVSLWRCGAVTSWRTRPRERTGRPLASRCDTAPKPLCSHHLQLQGDLAASCSAGCHLSAAPGHQEEEEEGASEVLYPAMHLQGWRQGRCRPPRPSQEPASESSGQPGAQRESADGEAVDEEGREQHSREPGTLNAVMLPACLATVMRWSADSHGPPSLQASLVNQAHRPCAGTGGNEAPELATIASSEAYAAAGL